MQVLLKKSKVLERLQQVCNDRGPNYNYQLTGENTYAPHTRNNYSSLNAFDIDYEYWEHVDYLQKRGYEKTAL